MLAHAPGELPAAVEAAAYFLIAEALTNVAKHGNAARVWVRVYRQDDTLHVTELTVELPCGS